jgi:outer membrane protein assembly factor BamB
MIGAALCALVALLPVAGAPDDPLPAALDALLLKAEDAVFFGVPNLADGVIVATQLMPGTGRSVVAVGDVNGDGWSEFAVGSAPGVVPALTVRDGHTAAALWQAALDGGGFRTLDGLAARGPWLAAGVSSARGRVECHAAATGALRWAVDLAPPRAGTADVLAVLWTSDLDADGQDDLLVAGGRSINAVAALSGADGHALWTHRTTGCAAALAEAGDIDHDGRPEVFVVGGSSTPFAEALSGATGAPLWTSPLPAPGSAALRLDDIDADGIEDLAAGILNTPNSSVVGLSGASGALRWSATSALRSVTALAPLSDVDLDGVRDLAVGSFDNAVTAVSCRQGLNIWHHEGSTNNTGAMLDVAALGDLDGNGYIDLVTASVDHQVYLFDGEYGHPLGIQDQRVRGVGVAALPDGDGDGRQEFVAAGEGKLLVLGGGSGTVLGPIINLVVPGTMAGETLVHVYALPQSPLIVMASLGTGKLAFPGFTGALGLELATLSVLHIQIAPAAGESGYVVSPVPLALAGGQIYYQAATIFEPGHGQIGSVAVEQLPLH